ncbi:F-box/FBD/LRR-repeat protein At4g00160 [Linum perenne]
MEYKRRSQLGRASKWCRYDGDSTNRLSYLPDFVLYHILSFVDTRTVVQTSVLSRWWRCVWKHFHTLDFNIHSFRYCCKRFRTFVDKVLSLRYPTKVDKISYVLIWRIQKLLEYAVSQETRHLVLNMSCELDYHAYKFPQSYRSISNCNLNTLQLLNFVIDDRFESFGFQLLTKLELNFSIYDSDQELRDPFSKFPCLKNLRIHSEGTSFAVSLRG